MRSVPLLLLLRLQDPVRSIVFNPISIRDGHPRVHAFMESRDGSDLLVGIANGEGKWGLGVALVGGG